MIIGNYVRTFAEADWGMLDRVSLNAPYPFFWVRLISVEPGHILCTGAGKEMRLAYRATRSGDRARITMKDPLFGPQQFDVLPFKERDSGGHPEGENSRSEVEGEACQSGPKGIAQPHPLSIDEDHP